MSKSKIEWTNETWNPVTGCTKISQGCKNCYAEREWPRLSAPGQPYHGRKFTDVRIHMDRIERPLHWKKPRMVFVNSMSDLFHEDIEYGFIDYVFAVIGRAQNHIFQILTKRPRKMLDYFNSDRLYERILSRSYKVRSVHGLGQGIDNPLLCPMPHVWLGVSVEDQETANKRIPLLLQTPAAVRWLSVEPMLGPVSITSFSFRSYDWVVCGGESGPKARPMDAEWARSLLKECKSLNVPFFMKQGSAANWPDFKNFESFPADLQVREYPE